MNNNNLSSVEAITLISGDNTSAEKVKSTFNFYSPKHSFRLWSWRSELKKLSKDTGLSMAGIAEDIGVKLSDTPGFYLKLPKEKETYVKLGLALKQPVEVVNKWIIKNTKSPALYAKDPIDLIGIYFLNINYKQNCGFENSKRNIDFYTSCLQTHKKDFRKSNSAIIPSALSTAEIENDIKELYNEDDLLTYISTHREAFLSANKRSWELMRKKYIDIILSRINTLTEDVSKWTLYTLKDKCIISPALHNYLCGDGYKTQVPRKKSTYIFYGLSLGMSLEQICTLLKTAGYDALNLNDDSDAFAEFAMYQLLISWENNHPEAKKFRCKTFYNNTDIDMTPEEELEGIMQLFRQRQDITNEYNENYERNFPF